MLVAIVGLVRENSDSVQTTLHLEEAAVADDWEMVNRAAFDAMDSCDHLVVNIEKISRFDTSLLLLICAIRRTAHLLGKKVTVQGNMPGSFICAYEYALRAKSAPCTQALSNPCCLWESLSGPVPHPLLEWWRNNLAAPIKEKPCQDKTRCSSPGGEHHHADTEKGEDR